MLKMTVREKLKNRRHLTTSFLSFYFTPDHRTDTPGDKTATINITSLPAHQMYSTYQVDPEGNEGVEREYEGGENPTEGGEESSAQGASFMANDSEGEGEGEVGEEGEHLETSDRWHAHSSTSLSYDVPFDGSEGWESGGTETAGSGGPVSTTVAIWQPTVSIGGGGSTSEDSHDPVTFSVSRDIPDGYIGGTKNDDAIPDTSVSLTADGTATPGVDYKPALPTSVTLKHIVGQAVEGVTTDVPDGKLVRFKAELDDEYDEPTETVNYILNANGNAYDLGPGQVAEANILNTVLTITLDRSFLLMKNGAGPAAFEAITATIKNGNKVVQGKNIHVSFIISNPMNAATEPVVKPVAPGVTDANGQVLIDINSTHASVAQFTFQVSVLGTLLQNAATLVIDVRT